MSNRVAAERDQQSMDLSLAEQRGAAKKGMGAKRWSIYTLYNPKVDRHDGSRAVPGGARLQHKRSSFLMSGGSMENDERRRNDQYQRVFSVFDHNSHEWVKMKRYVIHPSSLFSAIWNIFGATFIVMCVLFIPFEMTFDYQTQFGGTFNQGFWHVMNPIMDVFFMLDLLVHFCTAFVEDGEMVQDHGSIAKRYLLGWFSLDFVSSMSSILVYALKQQAYGSLRNVRILRLVRLLKLLRIAKLKQILDNLDGVRAEMRVIGKLLKLLLMCLAITHMIACGFYMVAKTYTENFEGSWVATYYESFLGMKPSAWKTCVNGTKSGDGPCVAGEQRQTT